MMSKCKDLLEELLIHEGEIGEKKAGGSDEEDCVDEDGVLQEFQVPGEKLVSKSQEALSVFPVEVNKLIVQIHPKKGGDPVELAQLFYAGKQSEIVGGNPGFCRNKLVIVQIMDLTDLEEDEDPEAACYFRGVILSSSISNCLYEVFLFDLGIIKNVSQVEMTAVNDDEVFLSSPPSYIFLTIPGIVPRKRMDSIPGLANMNFQDKQWNKGSVEDEECWLKKYPVKVVYKIKEEAVSLWYGDLYGSQSRDSDVVLNDSLSGYLIQQKNVFMNLKTLNLV